MLRNCCNYCVSSYVVSSPPNSHANGEKKNIVYLQILGLDYNLTASNVNVRFHYSFEKR